MINHVAMRCVLLSAALAVAFCDVAIAANQGKRTYRSTPDGEGALTQEMIEECITLKGNIDTSYAEFQAIEKQYDAASKAADALVASLKALDAAKNRDSRDDKELADYNKQIMDYKEKLAEANKLHEEMQAKKAAYDQQTTTFDQQCKDQPSYEDDQAAAVKKMGKSM